MRAPFPYFGGKSRAAPLVWAAFGDVANYIEPFAGSLAVLLARPTDPRIETVNDLDCYLANFWRATQAAPAEVARWADWPVNEADLHARHLWLVRAEDFRERMKSDPDFFDAKIAGWWVWGLSAWLGSGWCDAPEAPPPTGRHENCRALPRAESIAAASTRQQRRTGSPSLPPPRVNSHVFASGKGRIDLPPPIAANSIRRERGARSPSGGGHPSRQLPELYWSKGIHQAAIGGCFDEVFGQLAARLRRVRVCCGDWRRVLTDSVTIHVGTRTGILLDPPYDDGNMTYAAGDAGISADVRAWAIEHGEDKRLRIALCGYEGEHAMPSDWQCVPWRAKGGYAKSDENSRRERIWFSPGCLPVVAAQGSLFAAGGT